MPPCKASPLILSMTRLHATGWSGNVHTIQVAVPEARPCTLTCIVVLLEIMREDLHPLPAQALLRLHHCCEPALAQTLVSAQRETSSCALRCNATESSFRVADRYFRSSLEHERCSGLNVAYQFTRRPAPAAGLSVLPCLDKLLHCRNHRHQGPGRSRR